MPFTGQPTWDWDDRTPIYVISVAAQLAGMHPQTLRQYDRLGLVVPSRATGRGRRYSAYDVARLRYVQHLSQEEGVNLAGIRRILDLQSEVEDLRKRVNQLLAEVQRGVGPMATQRVSRIFSAGPAGDVIAMGRQQTTTRWIRTQPLELGPR
ncbi:heat shock protein transcriptional repressor HspR [Kribbella deserti]|uniref:Heat shock protein transcriptional repressor HspR n=1 Tax=Kribbella deserti TaxID=1926257 RepID=A0ABV6QRI8_9ACTN